jgi:hypothetical protein
MGIIVRRNLHGGRLRIELTLSVTSDQLPHRPFPQKLSASHIQSLGGWAFAIGKILPNHVVSWLFSCTSLESLEQHSDAPLVDYPSTSNSKDRDVYKTEADFSLVKRIEIKRSESEFCF